MGVDVVMEMRSNDGMTPFGSLVKELADLFKASEEQTAIALLDLFKRGVLDWKKL